MSRLSRRASLMHDELFARPHPAIGGGTREGGRREGEERKGGNIENSIKRTRKSLIPVHPCMEYGRNSQSEGV